MVILTNKASQKMLPMDGLLTWLSTQVWAKYVLFCEVGLTNKAQSFSVTFFVHGDVWFTDTFCQAKIWQPHSLVGMCLVFATLICMYGPFVMHRVNLFANLSQSLASIF